MFTEEDGSEGGSVEGGGVDDRDDKGERGVGEVDEEETSENNFF